MTEQYLLRKRGVYYRPHSRGYTALIQNAGLYSEEEALHLSLPGVVEAIPVSAVRSHIVDEIEQLKKSTSEMEKRLAHLDTLKTITCPLSVGEDR
ncbi:MAG: hypothetical protein JKY34_15185 [Kordiimonadaceae bacterium]|nr:hypothetical protein [Kordiimonadaceae bacterium]